MSVAYVECRLDDVLRDGTNVPIGRHGTCLVNAGLVRRLDGARAALERRIILYCPEGAIVPAREWIAAAAHRDEPPAYRIRPSRLAFGSVAGITPSVESLLGVVDMRRFLDTYYGPVSGDGWWTAFLENLIMRTGRPNFYKHPAASQKPTGL